MEFCSGENDGCAAVLPVLFRVLSGEKGCPEWEGSDRVESKPGLLSFSAGKGHPPQGGDPLRPRGKGRLAGLDVRTARQALEGQDSLLLLDVPKKIG